MSILLRISEQPWCLKMLAVSSLTEPTNNIREIIRCFRNYNEVPCFECLWCLRFTPDLKWNADIQSISKDAWKKGYPFNNSRKYLIPLAMLNLYKSQISVKIEYCYSIWVEASQFSLSSLDRVDFEWAWSCGEWLIFHSTASLPQAQNCKHVATYH